jgi:hypothetical protein
MADIVKAAIGLKPREAIDFLREKTAVTSEHWTDVWKQAHARSFMVAGAATQALVDDFHQAVIRAIDEGRTLRDFRRDFDSIVEKHGWVHNGTAGWRANIIYETNLSMAYAAGRYAQMTQPASLAVFPYWQYVHSGSRHPRVQHLAWNGLTLRADDPWWDSHYPPNGWHCGCRVRPLMRRDLERLGKDAPDTAPPIETRPWTNRHTGEVHQVPIGIDPGFDYNVGKAWLGPVPGDAAELRGGDGWKPVKAPPPEPAAKPVLHPPTPSPIAVPPAASFGDWVQRVVDTGRPGGTGWSVGIIPDAIARDMLDEDAPRDITLSSAALRHMLRGSKVKDKRALSVADVLAIPERLAQPMAILLDTQDGKLLFVFASLNDPDQRLAKVVVATDTMITVDRKKHRTNTIVTAGLVRRSKLLAARYRLLQGAIN